MKWLDVVTSLDTISQANNNVTVEFSNVTKLESRWVLLGMNLVIKNSSLPKTAFYLSNHLGGINNFVTVTMSTFGSLQVGNGFKIQISNCLLKGDAWKSKPFMDIKHSTIIITSSSFQGFKTYTGPAVLSASSSMVHLENSQFLGNIGKQGVIQVENKSHLFTDHTLFKNSGLLVFSESTILVKSGSKAVFRTTKLVRNYASTGGSIRSFPGTYLDVQNSTFSSNRAAFGGAVYCEGALYRKSGQSIIEKCNQPYFRFVNSTDDPQCSITKSTFNRNLAILIGADTYFNTTTVKITYCSFSQSGGPIKGGVMMVYTSDVIIDTSIFSRTRSIFEGGTFSAEDNCNIMINNSLFEFSTAMRGSTIEIKNRVVLTLNNVTVKEGEVSYKNSTTVVFADGYSFAISNHCSLTAINSYFEPIYPFPWVFYMEENSNLTVTGSTFKSRDNSSAQIVSAVKLSMVNFTKCLFQTCAGFVVSDDSSLSNRV